MQSPLSFDIKQGTPFLSQAALFLVVVLWLLYLRISRAISYSGGVPRVGKPGVLGYIQTAIKWTFDSEAVILEGRKQFSNKPFVIPTLSQPFFFLGPEYLARVRAGPDAVFNSMMAVNEELQFAHTLDEHQMGNPYQSRVLRTDINRALPSFIPELLEESELAIEEVFKATNSDLRITDIAVFDTMTHLIARISNRVILGKELCRNQKFLRAVVRFAETLPLTATLLQWSPSFLRPSVYFVLSSIMGGKKAPLKFLIPFVKQHMRDREDKAEKPNLVSKYLIQSAPPQETIEGIALRLLNLNFGSIHTSSIIMTQALYEIALLSPQDIESMRSEIREAIESEGGWTKGAVDKFSKVDSALREVGRFHGLAHYTLVRYAVVGYELDSGKFVPPGSRVAVDMKAIHFDSSVYPDPNRCDLFRFSNLRAKDGLDSSKYAFATVDPHYLPFGAGRHACAGRFFAALELKIMLAHILLEYDISYPPTVTQRPENLIFNGAIIPDFKTRLWFKRRPNTTDKWVVKKCT